MRFLSMVKSAEGTQAPQAKGKLTVTDGPFTEAKEIREIVFLAP